MKRGLRLDKKDNVGVVIDDVLPSEQVSFDTEAVVSLDDIKMPHKIALSDIHEGSAVIKYGEAIGYATCDIAKGAFVHVHNIDSEKNMK